MCCCLDILGLHRSQIENIIRYTGEEERAVSRNVIIGKNRHTSCVTFVDHLVKYCTIHLCSTAGKKRLTFLFSHLFDHRGGSGNTGGQNIWNKKQKAERAHLCGPPA